MKKKVLWISYYVPYDTVPHAGGKNHNFHLKSAQKSGLFDIHLISLGYEHEINKVDLDKYHIKNTIGIIPEDFFHKTINRFVNFNADINPFAPYCGFFRQYKFFYNALKQYKLINCNPDIIILQWTQVVLLVPYIKELFPQSKLVAIEEDVSFLGLERQYIYEKNPYLKWLYKLRFKKLKKLELDALAQCDLVFVNNLKDKKLLLGNNFSLDKVHIIPIYYDSYFTLKHSYNSNNILFFGAMRRKENHLSAMWFIKNVMPYLPENITFTIVGSNPRKSLLKLQNSRINITGFVNDVSQYFENCLCSVAPLVLGAGIKVKILETLSAGVPVLTNYIGIEGIPAKNEVDYYHCESPNDYISTINKIYNNRDILTDISNNARHLMLSEFNKETRMSEVLSLIKSL